MSDYHILQADPCGNAFTIAAHFPVPTGNNDVGYPYQTAIVEIQGGAEAITSAVPFIEAAELADLQAGTLYERVYTFHSHPGETLTEKRDRLDALYSQKLAQVQAELGAALAYWGYDRDVP